MKKQLINSKHLFNAFKALHEQEGGPCVSFSFGWMGVDYNDEDDDSRAVLSELAKLLSREVEGVKNDKA